MTMSQNTRTKPASPGAAVVAKHTVSQGTPSRIVLVLQGGGALGAYQAGVYQALNEAGLRPDWVIGTSIGAINASLIAGNRPEERVDHLKAFWRRMEQGFPSTMFAAFPFVGPQMANWFTVASGIEGFFAPNPFAFASPS